MLLEIRSTKNRTGEVWSLNQFDMQFDLNRLVLGRFLVSRILYGNITNSNEGSNHLIPVPLPRSTGNLIC